MVNAIFVYTGSLSHLAGKKQNWRDVCKQYSLYCDRQFQPVCWPITVEAGCGLNLLSLLQALRRVPASWTLLLIDVTVAAKNIHALIPLSRTWLLLSNKRPLVLATPRSECAPLPTHWTGPVFCIFPSWERPMALKLLTMFQVSYVA